MPCKTISPRLKTSDGAILLTGSWLIGQRAYRAGSGMGSALLGVGAGLAGGYLLNSALSGADATAATAAAPAEGGQSAVAAAPAPAAAPASPVANLLGYDTANYCTQLSQGNADVMQQCTAAEAAATAAFRQCVAMSTGLNGIGSYDALLRCLRGMPAAQ